MPPSADVAMSPMSLMLELKRLLLLLRVQR
jgi:hypothetical protein